MKNWIPAIAAFVISLQTLFALPPSEQELLFGDRRSTLEIRSQGSSYITVMMDGHYFGDPVKHFTLNDLQPGDHFIEVFIETFTHSGFYTSGTERIYSGKIYLQPNSIVKAVVDNFGRFQVKDVEQYADQGNNYYPHEFVPAYQPFYNVPAAMNNNSFSQLLSIVHEQWFDDAKLAVVNQALAMNFVTSSQVLTLMKEFSFESNKLALAKSAYSKVIDKQNYFLVNNEFWYNSSVEELTAYVINNR